MKTTTTGSIIALASIAIAVTACGEKTADESGHDRVALPEHEGGAPPLIGEGTGADEGAAPASATGLARELAELYRAWSADEEALLADFGKALKQAIAREGIFADRLEALYAARDGQPIMSRDGLLIEDADQLVQAIESVETHALDPEPYELERLAGLLQEFSQGRLEAETEPAPGQDETLWKFVLEHRQDRVDEPALADSALKRGLSDEDVERLREARRRLDKLLSRRKALNQTLAELDAFLAGKLYRWVFDMRFYRRAHPFLADRSEEAGLARVAPELDKLMAIDLAEKGAIAGLVQSVVPRFPDYEPTREALQRYRDYAERYPDHIELGKEVTRLKPGKSGEAVKLLEQRLIQEEYLSGEPTGMFSSELEEALMVYQQTHQMKATGRVDRITQGSLNKPYAVRAQQIALSLQRYRESELHQGVYRFGEVPIRARVNIPAMEARFYLGTELARRHRVVVGNNDVETDAETGKRGKLNQTRLLTAEIATIVLNPVWNVPKRIKEQELDLMLMDEPDYYEKHNFKVEINPDGTERVVQQPGPGNALGLVKFLFPNEFAIYMHDTPHKRLFNRPVRAFSHGCMRTENPLDLARWLLVEVDQEMDDETFDAVLAKREERHFAINPKIPISTDYVTTTIDEDGRLMVLDDIYGFDRAYEEGKTPFRNDRDIPMTVLF